MASRVAWASHKREELLAAKLFIPSFTRPKIGWDVWDVTQVPIRPIVVFAVYASHASYVILPIAGREAVSGNPGRGFFDCRDSLCRPRATGKTHCGCGNCRAREL